MKFKLNSDFIVDTESTPWKTEGLRIGLWGGSGCGKSSTAALLAEQFLTQGGVLIVFAPRAEYYTLKEKFDVVVCGGPYNKDMDFVPSSPAAYAKAVVENGVSIIFYTSDVEDETKLIDFISKFLIYLVKYNEVAKRPIMLTTEETEEYAPISTKGRVSPPWVFSRMIRQFRTVARDARKLNIVTVNLSPRPQEINFTIRQLCNLTFFGKFSPQDASYVERECLKHYKHSFYSGKDLLTLKTGQFAVITSGTSLPLQKITEPRQTKHGAETPKLEYTAPRTEKTEKAVTDLSKIVQEALEKERLEESELEKERARAKKLEEVIGVQTKELERIQTALEVAGKIKFEQPPSIITPTQIATIETEVAERLRKEVTAIFDRYKPSETTRSLSTDTKLIYETWAPKLPHAAKRILKLLAIDKKSLHLTKREIAVALGYRSTSGTFNGAISTLKRNHLIKYDGTTLWVE